MSEFFESIINGNNFPCEGRLIFHSNTHQRYEQGVPVRGEQIGCDRDVVIEKNISGLQGYTVSVENPHARNSFFGTPMSAKPMKIILLKENSVILRGSGYDRNAVAMGVPLEVASFADYGLTIYHNGKSIEKCVVHMYDRNVDIEYYLT